MYVDFLELPLADKFGLRMRGLQGCRVVFRMIPSHLKQHCEDELAITALVILTTHRNEGFPACVIVKTHPQ